MRGVLVACAVVASLGLAGCGSEKVEIEMRVEPGGVRRTAKVFLIDSGSNKAVPSDQRLAELTALYGSPRLSGDEAAYEKVFPGALPADLYGYGRLDRQACSLGTLYLYAERFGGTAEPLRLARERASALDMFGALLASRVRTGRDAARLEPVAKALETTWRAEFGDGLEALLLAASSAAVVMDGKQVFTKEDENELLPRSLLAVENGHAPDLLAGLPHGGIGGRSAGSDPFDSAMEHLAAAAPGGVLPAWISGKDDRPEAERKADEQAWLGSDLLKKAVAGWNAHREETGLSRVPLLEPAPKDADELLKRVCAAGGAHLDRKDQQLDLALRMPGAPLATNGHWDEGSGVLRWTLRLHPNLTTEVAPIAFARWVVPDAAFQREHFGRVAVEGSRLLTYVVEFRSLADGQRAAWEAAVATLKPAGATPEGALALLPPAADPKDPYALLRDTFASALTPPAPPQPPGAPK